MIAGFIFLRLRGILGKRTGFEGKAPPQFKEAAKNINIKPTDRKKEILMKMLKKILKRRKNCLRNSYYRF